MSLREKIEDVKEALGEIRVNTQDELEQFRIKFLGAKNIFKDLYQELKDAPAEHKRFWLGD